MMPNASLLSGRTCSDARSKSELERAVVVEQDHLRGSGPDLGAGGSIAQARAEQPWNHDDRRGVGAFAADAVEPRQIGAGWLLAACGEHGAERDGAKKSEQVRVRPSRMHSSAPLRVWMWRIIEIEGRRKTGVVPPPIQRSRAGFSGDPAAFVQRHWDSWLVAFRNFGLRPRFRGNDDTTF